MEPQRDSWRRALREHPVITTVILAGTLLGAVAGFVYLGDDWSAARRILAGAVGGAGSALLVTLTKIIGDA